MRLAAELAGRSGVEISFLCAEFDPGAPHGSLRTRHLEGLEVHEVVNNWTFDSLEESAAPAGINRRLEEVLDQGAFDLLHLHSLQGLSLDLPRLARDRGLQCVATLHDYSLFCPAGGQLLPHGEDAPCRDIAPERCARCFARSPLGALLGLGRVTGGSGGDGLLQDAARAAGALKQILPSGFGPATRLLGLLGNGAATPAQVARRLERARDAARLVDRFVAPSRSMAETMIRLGVPAEKVEVSDYGFPPLAQHPRTSPGRRLRLGFVGSLVPHKGADLLLQAARALPPGSFEAQIHGDPGVSPDHSARLRRLARGMPVRFAGPFAPGDAPSIYAGLDCLVVTSRWPENSPLVIHEAFQAGIPVVAPDSGGCAELVEHGINGLLFRAGSAPSLARQLACLVERPALVEDLARERTEVKSIARDADEWLVRYRRALAERPPRVEEVRPASEPAPDVSILMLTRDGAATLPRALAALEAQETNLRTERVALDSGSTDGTVPLLESGGFTVHHVEPETFQHGRTRNHGVARCRGELVLLLVQDAVPLGRGWLDALTAPLLRDSRVAGSFARQVPREDADPLTRFYAGKHHAGPLARTPRLIFLHPDQASSMDTLPAAELMKLCAFDNVSSCVRRQVWEELPFPEEPFAEDLAWARDVLAAGHGLAYTPAAVVEHSHQRAVGYELRRAYLAHRQLRRLFGLRTVPSPAHLHAAVAGTVGSHLLALADDPLHVGRHLPRALALGLALPLGQYLGALSADTGLHFIDAGGV